MEMSVEKKVGLFFLMVKKGAKQLNTWIATWWFFTNPFEKYANVKMGDFLPQLFGEENPKNI